jgi:hypothetical protein
VTLTAVENRTAAWEGDGELRTSDVRSKTRKEESARSSEIKVKYVHGTSLWCGKSVSIRVGEGGQAGWIDAEKGF